MTVVTRSTHGDSCASGRPQIDVAGERVDLLAVDEHLHRRDRRQVGGQRVDDRVDGQQFVLRAAGMRGDDLAAEVDVRLARSVTNSARSFVPGGTAETSGSVDRRDLRLDDRRACSTVPSPNGTSCSTLVEPRAVLGDVEQPRLDLPSGRRRGAVAATGAPPGPVALAPARQRRRTSTPRRARPRSRRRARR